MGWNSGPGKGGQKNAKIPPLVTFPPANAKPKAKKIFFSMSSRRLAESVEGLNSSLTLAAGDLWPKNCEPIDWLARSLKGYEVVKCAYQVRHPRKHSLSALKCSFEASAFSYCIVSAPLLPCWSKTDQWNLHSPCVLYKSKRNCELQYAIPLGMLLSYSLRMMLWFVFFFYLLAYNKHLFHGQAGSV